MDLQQELMEFVYGLLDEDEANAICDRITSDPEVARAYAKVKLQCDLLARAARVDAPNVAWIRPEGIDSSDDDPQPVSSDWSKHSYRRLANWCVGLAASGLLCLVGSNYWMTSTPRLSESTPVAIASTSPVKVVLTGPSKLNVEASNPFTVRFESQAGTPVSTTLNYRVFDGNGAVSWEDTAATNESGVAQFDVDGDVARDASRLEVSPENDSAAPILRPLEATPERFATYLRTDRPLYQPGEQVFYRSVTLSQFGLRADKEVTTLFDVVDENDKSIAGAANVVETDHGVGSGTVSLPNDLPDGKYTLLARSPDNSFRQEWRDFEVRRYQPPRLLKKLELVRDSYTAGEEVELDFSVKRVAGKPLADVDLDVKASLDGLALPASGAKTDAAGKSRISLRLPESIERGRASVSVSVKDGEEPAETITKDIPINLGKLNVDFYPEGGELAADLPTRMYFFGRDPLGRPTHIEGKVVDSSDNKVADVVTTQDGRGVFSITAKPNEPYRLMIDKPVGVTKELSLPLASSDRFATLGTGEGVFEANAPVAFTLLQRLPAKPLVVAAYCRGAMVAQRTVEPSDFERVSDGYARCQVELAMPDEAQGVVRLTVFNGSESPPTPIAERLVYRRVGQRLEVQLAPDAEAFAPGQSVQLDLRVRDENDAPVPAVLGISIVDDAVLNLADDKSVRMPTYFHLLTELDSAEHLEDANFYLSNDPESAAALDSLLGTQGWRRFMQASEMQFAQAGGGGFGGGVSDYADQTIAPSRRSRSLASVDDGVVPLSTASVIERGKTSLVRSSRSHRSVAANDRSFGSLIIIASIGLLVMVCVASMRRVGGNRYLLIPAAMIALVSLLVGTFSLPKSVAPTGGAFSDAASPSVAIESKFERDSQPAIAAGEADELLKEEEEVRETGDYRFRAEDVAATPAAPAGAMPLELAPSRQLEATSESAARLGVPRDEPERKSAAVGGDKSGALMQSKEKATTPPSPIAQPEPSAAPTPPQSAAKDAGGQRLMMDEPLNAVADQDDNRAFRREYAPWFYDSSANGPVTEGSSSTIFWHPLFIANKSGKATVYFNLPQRPSSFRAIVEAHGADRLGAGELLINSTE